MDPSVGGNVLIPGSHIDHFPNITRTYADRFAKLPKGIDHFRFPVNDPHLNGVQMSHMEPGDMLIWDSRIVHCSSPGIEAPKKDRAIELTRVVSLVCMMPRNLSSEEVLSWRKTK